jgi:hypothetical protein
VDDVHQFQHAEADRQNHQHCGDKPEFVGLRVNRIGLVLYLDLVHAPFSIGVRAQDTMIVTMIALRPMKPPARDQAQTRALVALKDCHVFVGLNLRDLSGFGRLRPRPQGSRMLKRRECPMFAEMGDILMRGASARL